MNRFVPVLLVFVSTLSLCLAQAPKREFRGVWVATVFNSDWPSRSSLSTELQQAELLKLIDTHKKMGMNALIFQVRPASDAFYYSAMEPWSEWLTGEMGKGPQPFYDPLSFAIEACHARGMELHAWINPFRVLTNADRSRKIDPRHISLKHPEWVLRYGSNLYLDPGIPEAREYVLQIMSDLVSRYDIDAVHIDDYFYPYRIAGQDFPDTLSRKKYLDPGLSLEAWRRNNTDIFVYDANTLIKRLKPWVKLGISPFGVWRNRSRDPLGSDTRAGQSSYDDLYADIRKWLQNRWIDYVAPQLYFSIGYNLADYELLLDWWALNTFGRHLYVGKAAYKVNNNADQNWNDPNQLNKQIKLDRSSSLIQGSAYFSATSLIKNPLGISDSLAKVYKIPAYQPLMNWLSPDQLVPPAEISYDLIRGGILLRWRAGNLARYVAIYRFPAGIKPNTSDNSYLLALLPGNTSQFVDETLPAKGKYTYLLTFLDKLQSESLPSLPLVVSAKKKHIRVKP